MATTAKKAKAKRARARRRLYKALSHELRGEIWTYLIEHSTGSPSEIARALGASVSSVSNQMTQLLKYEIVELVDERPSRRGSAKHVYRLIARDLITTEEVGEMELPARQGFAGRIVHAMIDDVNEGSVVNAFAKRADWFLTRNRITLDRQGWKELSAALERLLQESYEIQARSDQRRLESGDEGLLVSTSQLAFIIPESS
jgi:predicted ArsR family transcriptional regulator